VSKTYPILATFCLGISGKLNWRIRGRIIPHLQGPDESLARPTSRCVLFDGENISFDTSLFIYVYSTNVPPIMIINRIYEHKNLLSL
jgi:hypothetical protein